MSKLYRLFSQFQSMYFISVYTGCMLISFVCIGSVLIFSGCTEVSKAFKADPAEPSGFIEEETQGNEWRERAPFHRVWFKERERFYREREKYRKIHFPAIRTDYLMRKGWWDSLNTADSAEYRKDVQQIANYIHSAFVRSFSEDPRKRFEVVESPDNETIIYELALVELIATKAHVNAAGTALGTFVPGGGLIKTFGKGSIAIEAKAFDGESGELLVTWSDREQDPATVVSLNDFSFYSHARTAIDSWAEQLVEIYNTPMDHQVADSLPLTVMPF